MATSWVEHEVVNDVGSISRSCAGCGAPLPTRSGGPGPVICANCGKPHSPRAIAELDYLDRLEAWVPQRRAWLERELAAGVSAPLAAGVSAPPPGVGTGPSAGPVLLVMGAVVLVAAGIAFVALAWDALGPIGQVSSILVVGLLVLLGATRIPDRLRGTAETVGVVGAGFVAVAAIACRVLGVDALEPTGALAAGVLIGLVLGGCAFAVRRRIPVAGELAAASAVVLVSVLLATGPVGRAVPIDSPWSWWVALVLAAVGTAVFLVRSGFRTWGVLGAVLLFVGAAAGADAAEVAVDADRGGPSLVVWAATMLVAGLYVLGLTLLRRDRAVPLAVVSAALAVVALGRALVLGLDEPQIRPYAAVVVALIAAIVGLLLVFVPRLSTPPTLPRLRTPGRPFVGALAGIVVALVAVPWSQPPPVNLDYFGLDPDRADLELSQWQSIAQAIQAWVAQNWTTARAMGTAVAFVLLLVFVDAVMETARRRSRRWGTVSLSVMVVGLGYWLLVAGAAVGVLYSHPFGPTGADQPILRSVAVVVGAVAAAAVVESLRRALPVTALVGASAMWVAAVALALVSTGIRAFDDPDLRGALLALPLAITGLCAWWLTRPRPPSSWWTIAPALGMAFAIPTLAVVSDLISHTALGASVDDRYRIRVVVLLTLAAAGAVVGARERLAGVFWPAMLCLLVVVLTQLGEVARFVPQWVSLGTVGVVLVLTGARWEDVRTSGRRTNHWASGMR